MSKARRICRAAPSGYISIMNPLKHANGCDMGNTVNQWRTAYFFILQPVSSQSTLIFSAGIAVAGPTNACLK